MQIIAANSILGRRESLGPRERRPPNTEFSSHEAADADVKFLLALLKEGHPLASHICVPSFEVCAGARITFSKRCSPGNTFSIRSGLIVVNGSRDGTTVHIPRDMRQILESCQKKKKRFVVCNVGIYPGAQLVNGHANAIVFDLARKIVERYEPEGNERQSRLDAEISTTFTTALPGWTYIGTSIAAPRLGPQRQGDSYKGLCVTFSLLYVITRVLNPDRTPHEINHYLASQPPSKIRSTVLRLNRKVADTLRAYQRGSLVRRGSAPKRC